MAIPTPNGRRERSKSYCVHFGACELAFPDSQYAAPLTHKIFSVVLVTALVALKLWKPKSRKTSALLKRHIIGRCLLQIKDKKMTLVTAPRFYGHLVQKLASDRRFNAKRAPPPEPRRYDSFAAAYLEAVRAPASLRLERLFGRLIMLCITSGQIAWWH
jgi:hypothetical protein